MRKALIIAWVLIVLSQTVAFAIDEVVLKREANEKLSCLVDLMKDSYAKENEYLRGIEILKTWDGETDHDEGVVAVTVFTIESFALGNNFTQYMAVFANLSGESEGYRKRLSLLDVIAIGGKGIRGINKNDIKLKKIKGEGVSIVIGTMEYGPSDPLCCPSIKSNIKYIIKPNAGARLKEVKREPDEALKPTAPSATH